MFVFEDQTSKLVISFYHFGSIAGNQTDGTPNPEYKCTIEGSGNWQQSLLGWSRSSHLKAEVAALKNQWERSSGGYGRYEDGELSWRTKIIFPSFSGGDPHGWVFKAEKYFRYHNVADEDKVDIAVMHLEGEALDLYPCEDQSIAYWEDLDRVLNKIFGPTEFQNPDDYFCSIKQTGSVQEYRHEFAKTSAWVSD